MKCDMCGSKMRFVEKDWKDPELGEMYTCDNCHWCVLKFNAYGHESRIADLK